MEKTNKGSTTLKVVIGLVVVAVAAFFGLRNSETEQTTETNTNTNGNTEGNSQTESGYEDGTYSAAGNYTSPAGAEEVEISVTLNNGVISSADFEGKASNPTSKLMQERFASGFETLVVGKSIDEVSLSIVNGSSLAPKGFMDALAKIKIEAKS